jgi:hypothetical protein
MLKMKKWGLQFIRKLKPCFWKYKEPMLNDGRYHFGFIAQDIDSIASRSDYGFTGWKDGFMTINYWELIGPMVASIQELDAEVKKLKREIKRRDAKQISTSRNR